MYLVQVGYMFRLYTRI